MSFEQLVRSLHHVGYTHRALAARFSVSLRQIQKAIDPELRKQHDRDWYTITRPLSEAKRTSA